MRLVLVALLVACGGSKDEPAGGSGSTSAPADDGPRADLIAAWKKAGLEVGAFASAQTDAGKNCQAGKVNKLDVLVCVYGKAADAKSSEDYGYKWIESVGGTTGTAQAHGVTLIAVADKAKTDPHGKTINQLMKLAPN
jgi:hypothetical protein